MEFLRTLETFTSKSKGIIDHVHSENGVYSATDGYALAQFKPDHDVYTGRNVFIKDGEMVRCGGFAYPNVERIIPKSTSFTIVEKMTVNEVKDFLKLLRDFENHFNQELKELKSNTKNKVEVNHFLIKFESDVIQCYFNYSEYTYKNKIGNRGKILKQMTKELVNSSQKHINYKYKKQGDYSPFKPLLNAFQGVTLDYYITFNTFKGALAFCKLTEDDCINLYNNADMMTQPFLIIAQSEKFKIMQMKVKD